MKNRIAGTRDRFKNFFADDRRKKTARTPYMKRRAGRTRLYVSYSKLLSIMDTASSTFFSPAVASVRLYE